MSRLGNRPLRAVRLFLALPLDRKRLWMEAFVELGKARLQLLRPFAKVAPTLGAAMRETTKERVEAKERAEVMAVADAIQVMSRHTPWSSMCFTRAVAALRMLARRGIGCTLYLGTARDEAGKLTAHAWLRSGDVYVTGAEEKKRFATVGKFAHASRRNNEGGHPREDAQ
ncbi:lasso peptide biosynthesis B2 protein [Gorillibacterium sp. CAU 1737]|uniref:lasso peptide biosynthesis B2 protein n=1 Tax=Gorillibacterium sp. CAU 1737 TaxID=3140362 RepID=UPI00325FFF15